MKRFFPGDASSFLRSHGAAVFAVLYPLVLLPFIGLNRLYGLDEAIYANTAMGALRDGHWMPFFLMGEPFIDKPPLGQWIQAAACLLFGPSEWSLRLPSALASGGVLYLVWRLAARLGRSESAGFFATGMVALSEHFILYSRIANLDMMLVLCILGAWWELLNAFSPVPPAAGVPRESPQGHLLRLGFWTGAALLVKSLFAFVYILPAFLALRWSHHRPIPIRDILRYAGIPVLAAFAGWYALYGAAYGKAFFKWELFTNVAFRIGTGAVGRIFRGSDVDFHSWQLYAELTKNGFAFLWPLLPMAFLAWAKEARTGVQRRRADLLLLGGFVILSAYLFLVIVLMRPLINYLLPLAPLAALSLAALWRKPACLKYSLLLSGAALLALANGFTRHAFTGWKMAAACALALLLLRIPDTKPHHWGRRMRRVALVLLLAGSAAKALPYLLHPPDPNAKWAKAVLEHPAPTKGATLLFYGTPTDARSAQFYCDYRVTWTDKTPDPEGPRPAMLFEYQGKVHLVPSEAGTSN